MDVRVLLANNSKKYEAVFEALLSLEKRFMESREFVDGATETIYNKLIEMDEKLDLLASHQGPTQLEQLELPSIRKVTEDGPKLIETAPAVPGGSRLVSTLRPIKDGEEPVDARPWPGLTITSSSGSGRP